LFCLSCLVDISTNKSLSGGYCSAHPLQWHHSKWNKLAVLCLFCSKFSANKSAGFQWQRLLEINFPSFIWIWHYLFQCVLFRIKELTTWLSTGDNYSMFHHVQLLSIFSVYVS
jgi:hypothetical protein